jgi:hypothetical protein
MVRIRYVLHQSRHPIETELRPPDRLPPPEGTESRRTRLVRARTAALKPRAWSGTEWSGRGRAHAQRSHRSPSGAKHSSCLFPDPPFLHHPCALRETQCACDLVCFLNRERAQRTPKNCINLQWRQYRLHRGSPKKSNYNIGPRLHRGPPKKSNYT